MNTSIFELDLGTRGRVASALAEEAARVIGRFPGLFDERLFKGIERLIANSSAEFFSTRSLFLLKRILFAQFFLQRKIEEQDSLASKPILIAMFRCDASRICLAFASRRIQREQVMKTLQSLLPSTREVAGSYFVWHHPERSYSFSYLEIQKLRGKDPSSKELRFIESELRNHLFALSPLTPALFWPYNKEDSFRQIQFLQREIKSPHDLPHLSIHFQEQTSASLEFLVHLVRPSSPVSLELALRRLPHACTSFIQFHKMSKTPFPIEIGAFSVKIPSFAFEVSESINLLYARRYVFRLLETAFGIFRDTNGGLFEMQQQHFETIRVSLSGKIPHFELFAEKVFYALHPVETWLSFSLSEAEDFFLSFSQLLEDKAPFGMKLKKGSFSILKTAHSPDRLSQFHSEIKERASHAFLTLGGSHFLCLIGPGSEQAEHFSAQPPCQKKVLRLLFQEGPPPSLNPHYSSGDMRCRMLNKLLFEGLTRLDAFGEAGLAGAERMTRSPDGSTYTFSLKPSYWSNGEKVTAQDYVASWQSALADSISHPEPLFILKNGRNFRESRKEIGVRSLDSSTLQIELEQPNPRFLEKLSHPCFFPLFGAMREPKWFNGPYLLREQSKEHLLLEKNAYFWDSARSPFEQIEISWNGNDLSIFEQFQNGKLDWIGDPLTILSPQQINQLQEEKKLKAQKASRRFYLYFNVKHPALSSSLIRRALSLSVDRSFICGVIFPGSVPLRPLFPAKEEARFLFENGLKEAGLTRESFPSLTFRYSLQTRREKLAAYLQSAWMESLGISVRCIGNEWNDFRSHLEERTFDICGTIQDTIGEGSYEYLERFEGSNSWNFSQWSHPEFRRLLAFGKKEGAHLHRIQTLEQILEEQSPHTALFDYTHLYAHRPELDGYWIDPEGCVDFSRSFLNREEKNASL